MSKDNKNRKKKQKYLVKYLNMGINLYKNKKPCTPVLFGIQG